MRSANARASLRRLARSAAFLVGTYFLAGCHSYHQVETPTPGTTVRVRVPVRSAVADRNVPVGTSASIEGEVVSSGDTVVLAVRRRTEYGAFREIIRHDTISLVPEEVIAFEQREFSRDRSVVLGVGLALAATGLAATAFGIGGGQQGDVPGDGTATPGGISLIPLALLLFGR